MRIAPLHTIRISFLLFLFWNIHPYIHGNQGSGQFVFSHISIEDGLSGNIINKIIEDSYGYIWIATTNGLNRYDGYKLTAFNHNPADSSSLPGNDITSLAIDKNGQLWVGTIKGLCRFNYQTETFEKHLQKGPGERNCISSLCAFGRSQLLVGTQSGLYSFDNEKKVFLMVIEDKELNLYAPVEIIEHRNGSFLVGTWEKGLYCLNKALNHFTREIVTISPNTNPIGQNTIKSIFVDRHNALWLATIEGLIIAKESNSIGKSKFRFSKFPLQAATGSTKGEQNTHALCEDNAGRIWIGTENGLFIHDPGTQNTISLFNDPTDPYSISNNHIKCIYKDRNGNIWVGTYQGGVNVYHPNKELFRNFFPVINNAPDQKMRYVKAIYQDSRGSIWIGADKGLFQFSEEGALLHSYIHNPSDINSINIGGTTAILEDKKGRLWIGTWGGGMHEFNPATGKFRRLPWIEGVHNNYRTQGDLSVMSIAEDSKGNLWIGTVRGYLDKYNPESKIFEHRRINLKSLDLNAVIQVVTIDKEDNVWIGTLGAGLMKYDTKTNTFIRLSINPNTGLQKDSSQNQENIFSLYFSENHELWVGTNNGAYMLNTTTNKSSVYTTQDGLPSNTIYSIFPDEIGNVWFSSLKGISKYNLTRKAFINYDGHEGIRINSECGYKSSSGWLFFGGVNGINAINPSSIKENIVIPPIVFTDLKIFNKSVAIGPESILKKHINYTEEIILPYDQNVFSIEFAVLNYTNPEKNQYACKMEGFDRDWVLLGNTNENRYTNLSPGDYTFIVKGSNNDGIWNETGRILKITVLPPWWKTWWFRLISISFLFLTILFWVLARTIRLRNQQKQLRKLVSERTAEIEAQKLKLEQQTEVLLITNQLLTEKQNEVTAQKEAIAQQNEKLEAKNLLLEDQKNQISDQMKKEHELAEKLHEADQLKLRFFTNISHEFRTPLTLILGPTEKMLTELGPKHPIAELGKIIQRNTLRLLHLINQFLDITRLEAGITRLHITQGDIVNHIRGIVNAYQFAANQKNIDYQFESAPETHTCYFDADKLEKILYNLLSNAFKYTPSHGRITVSASISNTALQPNTGSEMICIQVSDTGIGIPKDQLGKIFQRFYQIDNKHSNHPGGTGIGLSLTQDLVNIYRGTIEVISNPGEGSCFTVCLPCDEHSFKSDEIFSEKPLNDELKIQLIAMEHNKSFQAEIDIAEHDDESMENPVQDDDRRPHLLLVDDSADIRSYLRMQLQSDYRITEAGNGTDGMELIINLLPDLVLCDVMMPGISGFELCAKIKTDLRTCHIPVVILTAKASAQDQLEGIETGADAYISKPFDVRLLETQIKKLLEGREQLKSLFRRELIIGPSNIVVESTDEKLINRIIKVMSENISNPDFGVEELGREVGLSRTHLYRKLKQLTNQTAIEFVRNMRLQRAAQLFRQNKLYVAEVVYMCGFKELSYFRKIFKEFYGMSPQEFINSCNQQ